MWWVVHAKRLVHSRPSANGVTSRGPFLNNAFEMDWAEFVGPFILFLEDLGEEILSVLEYSL